MINQVLFQPLNNRLVVLVLQANPLWKGIPKIKKHQWSLSWRFLLNIRYGHLSSLRFIQVFHSSMASWVEIASREETTILYMVMFQALTWSGLNSHTTLVSKLDFPFRIVKKSTVERKANTKKPRVKLGHLTSLVASWECLFFRGKHATPTTPPTARWRRPKGRIIFSFMR